MNPELEAALERRNDSPAALGNITRTKLLGHTLYVSPDRCAWIFPTALTLFLVASIILVTRGGVPTHEMVIFLTFLVIALAASYTVTITDPGVYPRLQPGEEDPLAHAGPGYVNCRACGGRRPPRTSHCYVCNVCVLEHDHHCGIIGGCVGVRSLRWFTLYLVTISTTALIGSIFVILELVGARQHPLPSPLASGGSAVDRLEATTVPGSAEYSRTHAHGRPSPVAAPGGRHGHRQSRHAKRVEEDSVHATESLSTAGAVILVVVVANIVLLVGGLGIYYVYLMCNDTTRREAQGKGVYRPIGYGGNNSTGCFAHLKKTMFPPPSMLEIPQEAPSSSIKSSASRKAAREEEEEEEEENSSPA